MEKCMTIGLVIKMKEHYNYYIIFLFIFWIKILAVSEEIKFSFPSLSIRYPQTAP